MSVRGHTPDFPSLSRDSPSTSYIGRRVGPHVICLELASGGMATVYLARKLGDPPQFVALKAIHRHLAERRDFVEMFVDEARISSRLHHPNICEVYDLEAADGTYFLAMEFLLGETLMSVFRRTARRASSDLEGHAALAVRLIADACAGLHAAHELRGPDGGVLNVVHRDVSPENVFVTYSGVTKVMDFGLASAAHQTHCTRTGIIKGKFGYVAPEQLSGLKADRRADVWSLGVVAWELLTGRRLFQRDSDPETLAAVATSSIIAPSTMRPGLPKRIDEPVLRALERNRSNRYATAQEFGRELLAACPDAASLSQANVADRMADWFTDDRRRKMQLLELVERLGTPGGFDDDSEDALTRIKTRVPDLELAPARTEGWVGHARTALTRWRAKALVPAGAVVLLLAGTALTREPGVMPAADPPETLTAGLVGPAVTIASRSQAAPDQRSGSAEPQSATRVPTELSSSELQSLELPRGSAYVLEISATGKPDAVRFTIRPDRSQTSRAGQSGAVGDRTGTAGRPAPLTEAETPGAPPVWLRKAMQADGRAYGIEFAGP
jgi:serine/threonine protein kinase